TPNCKEQIPTNSNGDFYDVSRSPQTNCCGTTGEMGKAERHRTVWRNQTQAAYLSGRSGEDSGGSTGPGGGDKSGEEVGQNDSLHSMHEARFSCLCDRGPHLRRFVLEIVEEV